MKNKKLAIEMTKKYALIVVGCIIYSLGVAFFLNTADLASGGVTGIAIMVNFVIQKFSGFELGTGWKSEI